MQFFNFVLNNLWFWVNFRNEEPSSPVFKYFHNLKNLWSWVFEKFKRAGGFHKRASKELAIQGTQFFDFLRTQVKGQKPVV